MTYQVNGKGNYATLKQATHRAINIFDKSGVVVSITERVTKPKVLKPGSLACIVGFPCGPIACKVLEVHLPAELGAVQWIKVKVTGKGFPVYERGTVTTFTPNCIKPRKEARNAH